MNDPRLEAAMTGLLDGWKSQEQRAGNVIARLDEADREQGIHRVRVDDATVERVAVALMNSQLERHGVGPKAAGTVSLAARVDARAVLAALTGADS